MIETLSIVRKVRDSFNKPEPGRSENIILPPLMMDDDFIHRDMSVRELYKKGWEKRKRKKQLNEVVLHGTAGGITTDSMLKWMAGGERAREYNRGIGLFHYLVGREGEVVEVIDPDYWVYHSGSGWHDKCTVGIELINPSKLNDMPYTAKQYEALEKLIFGVLLAKYDISKITSHRYNSIIYRRRYHKRCPGIGFEWPEIDEMLSARGLNFKTDGHLRYAIGVWV